MNCTTLGRPGVRVGDVELGCGGFRSLSQRHSSGVAHSAGFMRDALDAGVGYIGTSEACGTEVIIGQAFTPSEPGHIAVSTKVLVVESGGRRASDQNSLVIQVERRVWGDEIQSVGTRRRPTDAAGIPAAKVGNVPHCSHPIRGLERQQCSESSRSRPAGVGVPIKKT